MKLSFMSRTVGNINNTSYPQNSATTCVQLGQKLVIFRIMYSICTADR
jgi:hypothetical protein